MSSNGTHRLRNPRPAVPKVLRGSKEIRDQFPWDPWIHFNNCYLEYYYFVKKQGGVTLIGDIYLFRMAVRIYS